MRYCVYCGSQHDEGYAFCTKCGKPVFDIDAFIRGEIAEPTPEPKPEEPLPVEEEVIEEAPAIVEAEPIVEEKPVEAEAVIEEEPEEVADEAEEAPIEAQEEIPEEPVEEQPVEEPVEEEVPEEEPQAEEAPEEQPQVEEIPEEQPIEEPAEEEEIREEEEAPAEEEPEEKPEPEPEEEPEPEPEPEPAPKPEPVVEKPQPMEKPAANMGDGKMKDKKSVDVPQQYQPAEAEGGKLLRIPFIVLVIAAFACVVVGLGLHRSFEYSFVIAGAGALLAFVDFVVCLILRNRDYRVSDIYFVKVLAIISLMVCLSAFASTIFPLFWK